MKILDFGIAKRRFRDADAGAFTDTLTRSGEVVGTVTSMSPEQVEGKEVDHRSDIFSLGVLLYEMLSGRRPFGGETHAAVMNAIVSQEPEDLPTAVPEAVAGIVRRCLEKVPERRFQSAADLAYALRTAVAAQSRAGPQRERKRWPIAAVAVTGIVLAAAGAGYWWLRPGMRTADLHSVPLMPWPGRAYDPTFSPDGNRVAFAWRSEKEGRVHIYVEQIGSGARPVQFTNVAPGDNWPVWSPDDRYIAFLRYASSDERAALMLVPSIGGPERKIADLPGYSNFLAWTPDSKWLATSQQDSRQDSQQDPWSIWLVSMKCRGTPASDHSCGRKAGRLLALHFARRAQPRVCSGTDQLCFCAPRPQTVKGLPPRRTTAGTHHDALFRCERNGVDSRWPRNRVLGGPIWQQEPLPCVCFRPPSTRKAALRAPKCCGADHLSYALAARLRGGNAKRELMAVGYSHR